MTFPVPKNSPRAATNTHWVERNLLEQTRISQADAESWTTTNASSFENEDIETILNHVRRFPESQRRAFDQATLQVPEIVMNESNPHLFLDAEGGNSLKAANRLTMYWSIRVQVFKERAFLPMVLTKGGAMDEKNALAALKSGYCASLPDDKLGRQVLFMDPKLEKTDSPVARLQAAFYVLSALAQKRKPLVLVRFCHSQIMQPSELKNLAKLTTAFPMRMDEFHLIFMPRARASHLMKETFIPMLLQNGKGNVVCDVVYNHIGESTRSLFRQLAQHGFASSDLPESVGGTWNYADFGAWLEQSDTSCVADEESAPLMRKRPLPDNTSRRMTHKRQATIVSRSTSSPVPFHALPRDCALQQSFPTYCEASWQQIPAAVVTTECCSSESSYTSDESEVDTSLMFVDQQLRQSCGLLTPIQSQLAMAIVDSLGILRR